MIPMLHTGDEQTTTESIAVKFLLDTFNGVTDDPIYLCCLNYDGGPERHLITREPGKIDTFVKKYNQPKNGVYFCVSTVKRAATTRSKDTISEIVVLHSDID